MIIGVDVVPERLELARSLGCVTSSSAPGPTTSAEVRDLTHGNGVRAGSGLLG